MTSEAEVCTAVLSMRVYAFIYSLFIVADVILYISEKLK